MKRLTHALTATAAAALLAACSHDLTAPERRAAAPLLDVATTTTGPGPMASGLASNMCADVWLASQTPGAPVVAYGCHGGANQQFALQPTGEITAYGGALCLDVWLAKANDGDPVVAYTCNGGANQKWTRTAAGELRTGVNGKCLDLWGAQPINGAKLAVYTCHGGSNQKWTVNDASSAVITTPTPAAVGGSAELPRVYLDTRQPTVTGRSIAVPAGGDLQAALNAALPGDEVVLAAGATFVGNFVLPVKAGMSATQWVTVRTAGTLPAEGTRVGPADAAQMPKLLTPNTWGPALETGVGAQGWRIVGVEVSAINGITTNYSLVNFGRAGTDQNTSAQVPSRMVLDRSYVHGSSTMDLRRCVTLNSASSAVIDSYLADCHAKSNDSQAIAGWNGPGPYKISNNYLEGGHEVVMFGGNDPSVPGVVPGDIEFRRNHVTRPLSWKGVWQVKNLLELKTAQRLLIEGNVFENNWADAQNGFAFVWWSVNQDGGCTWCVTQDVTFRYNRVKNVPQGFNLAATGGRGETPMQRVTIAHNIVTGVDAAGGRVTQVNGGIAGLTMTNNSMIGGSQDIYFVTPSQPLPTLVYSSNVTGGQYTLFADGGMMGAKALTQLGISASNVAGNVIYSGSGAGAVPAGNAYVSSVGAIGFLNFAGGDLSLAATSPYLTSGGGGTRPGVDMTALASLISGVVR